MRGGAFFNGKEGRDDFRKLSFWLKGDGGIRKNSTVGRLHPSNPGGTVQPSCQHPNTDTLWELSQANPGAPQSSLSERESSDS